MTWIKLEDKLPAVNTEVLLFALRKDPSRPNDMTYQGGLRFIGYRNYDFKWRQRLGVYQDFAIQDHLLTITHWQPLPDYAINATTYKEYIK
jgi:hypothetical protein